MNNKITIITPTYNRGYIIRKAYESLCKQTIKNFNWVVIDDGSTDNTEELVKEFINENKIKIEYYKKKNGGKHTALNYGIKKINTDYTFILDSDDYLSDDAVEIMYKYIKKYDKNQKIGCLSFLKTTFDNNILGKKYDEKEIISNNIDFRYNEEHLGDMAELYRTRLLKENPFPEYKGEKFISECIVWNKIALFYDTVFINEVIYYFEYLEDGLSKGWFRQVVNSPRGARQNSLCFMNKRFKLKIRLKNCIEYGVFSIIAKENVMKDTKMKILSFFSYIPCLFIAIYLKRKYQVKNEKI